MYKYLSLLSRPQVFYMFCFVFNTFCLMFRVAHVYESNSYVVLYLLVIFVVCILTMLLFVCMIVHDTLYLCLYLCLLATQLG